MTGALTILFAPDSFKGSLTSVQVTRALADGWSRARPDDTLAHAPLGDGGEGSIHAIAFAGGWEWIQATVGGPLGSDVNAGWLRSEDGKRAFVELAEASGLSRVQPGTHDPIGASTRGTGQLLILSQVILSLQLSFAVFPLVMFTGDRHKMGTFASPLWVKALAWPVAVAIALLNAYLLWQTFAG